MSSGGAGSNVSDQPATCPLCNATLRQARNLRRHLELLHFGVGRSTVRVRSRRSSSPGAATVAQSHQATTLSLSSASGSGNTVAAAAVHALVGATVDAVVAAAAQRGANSTHSQSMAMPSVLAPAQHGSQLRTPPPLHPVTQPHPQSQMLQLAPLTPALIDAAQSHLLAPPPLPPHCQTQGLTPPMRRLDESGTAPPSALQSSSLLAASSSHEVFFRQHHSELLRGVGLYADPRTLPPTSTPAQLPPPPAHTHQHGHQPPTQQSSVIRQEVI